MKKITLFCALFITIASIAQSFTIDNINYQVTSSTPATVEVIESPSATGTITIPENVINNGIDYAVTIIGTRAFFGTSITKVTIPNSIIAIGGAAFERTQIKNIIIPNSVTTIGTTAFKLTPIEEVTFSTAMTTISAGIFDGTPLLKNITLPSNITVVEGLAFLNSGITNVKVENDTPPSASSRAFSNVDLSKAILTVPDGTKSIYEAALVWKDFGTIQEVSTLSTSSFNIKEDVKIVIDGTSVLIKDNNLTKFEYLKVYDLRGKEVLTSTELINTIDNLSKGLYIVRVNTNRGAISKKIIR